MGRNGRVVIDSLENMRGQLQRLDQGKVDQFIDDCAKELAARLLAKVIKRTPVGEYKSGSGKVGGTLRRGWTGNKNQNGTSYAKSLPIRHYGNTTVIEIVNPVEYASYVEFGHRTRNHKGWVRGRFMLTISEQEIQNSAPAIIEKKLRKQLGELFR